MLGETSNCGNLQAKWKVRWFVSLCGKLLWLFFKDPFKRRVFFTLQATISRYLPAILAVIKQAMVAANRVLIAILAMSLCRLGAIGPKPPSNTPRPRKLVKPQSAYVAMTSDRRYKRWDQENVIVLEFTFSCFVIISERQRSQNTVYLQTFSMLTSKSWKGWQFYVRYMKTLPFCQKRPKKGVW